MKSFRAQKEIYTEKQRKSIHPNVYMVPPLGAGKGLSPPSSKGISQFSRNPCKELGGVCDSVQGMSHAVPTSPGKGAGRDFSLSMARKGHYL